MKELQVYTKDNYIGKIRELPCMEETHILELDDTMDFLQYTEGPVLVVIDGAKDFFGFRDYVKQAEESMTYMFFLILLEKEDFSLVYEASRYQMVNFLLKSASKEEWNRRFEMSLERIKQTERMFRERALLEEYEFQKNHKIMERLLTNILNKPEEVECLLPEINKRYGTKLGDGDYQVILIHVNQYELSGQASQFFKEVTLLTSHMLSLAKEIIMGYREPYGLIGIVHYHKDTDVSRRKKDYHKLLQQIMQLKKRYGECLVTLSVGGNVEGISQVLYSLKEASLAKEYYMRTGEFLIFASEILHLHQDMESYLPERKRKELIRYIILGDIRHVNGWFLDFHQNLEPAFMEYPPAFSIFCQQVYCDIFEQDKTPNKAMFPEWKFFYLQHILDGYERNRQLEVLLLEICHMMAEGMEGDQDVAVKAIAYMKVHFKEPINLEFIAEKCGLSTSYFSRKFKEQTGENYIDVLTDIRIREAQMLLGTTDMSVREILEEVGYCDDKHFRKLFYKVTGLKPTEYRKKLRAETNF